jgi:hypothetical protein
MKKISIFNLILFAFLVSCSQSLPLVINSFSVDRELVTSIDSEIMLFWDVQSADSVTLSPDLGIQSEKGRKIVLQNTTIFTLTARTSSGTVSAQKTVTVKTPKSYELTVHLRSESGDFVGSGKNWDIVYNQENSTDIVSNVSQVIKNSPSFISISTFPKGFFPFINVAFSTHQLGISLPPGTYTNAERASFASLNHPGLDVGFDAKGCNEVAGSFSIEKIKFIHISPTRVRLDQLKASFIQNCETTGPPLHGEVLFNPIY